MSVSKRNGSKYFYIQFQYNGRTYIKSSKTPDKQLALNLEAQWRKQLIEQNQLGLKSPIEITKGFQLFVKSKSHIKSCWRRLNFDHLCRLNLDQGLLLV